VKLSVQRGGRAIELNATLTALNNAQLLGEDTAPSRSDASPASGNGLGLRVGAVDASTRRSLNLPEARGVKILAITSAMPQQAGLAVGDVILKVGRDEVNSVADFERAARGLKSGDTVRLQVQNESSSAMIAYPIE
jgi:serine protease Do